MGPQEVPAFNCKWVKEGEKSRRTQRGNREKGTGQRGIERGKGKGERESERERDEREGNREKILKGREGRRGEGKRKRDALFTDSNSESSAYQIPIRNFDRITFGG